MYNRPRMIIFDYGQTLMTEEGFNPIRGTQAVLDRAVSIPEGLTAERVQELFGELFGEISRTQGAGGISDRRLELPAKSFNRYIYEYFGVRFDISFSELEAVFWDAAAPPKLTEHIEELLDYLYKKGIRTAVISNMMNSGENLTKRINRMLPKHHFEFIISSADYGFRKPGGRLFELAARKAGLQPCCIWYCGDNPVCDVQGSYDAGMRPVWYRGYSWDKYEVPKDSMFGRYDNIPDIIRDAASESAKPYIEISDWRELESVIDSVTDMDKCFMYEDAKDYIPDGKLFERIAARAVIQRDGKYAMVYSERDDFYKLPGGGAEPGERLEDTLIREVHEETGMIVVPETVRYIGWTEETNKGRYEDIFRMTSYFFVCDVRDEMDVQELDDYENEGKYVLKYVTAEEAAAVNRSRMDDEGLPWLKRESVTITAIDSFLKDKQVKNA